MNRGQIGTELLMEMCNSASMFHKEESVKAEIARKGLNCYTNRMCSYEAILHITKKASGIHTHFISFLLLPGKKCH